MTHQAFPAEAFTHHLAILGKTGSGKTTAAKGFAETLLDSGRRICTIDPTGVWWGLRLNVDGQAPGYPVVIFGGSHGDVSLDEETSGSRLAEIIAAGTFSSIVDTSLMTVGARTRFFTEFAETLFRANSRPLHLIVDEAHLFAPQSRVPDPQSGRMLHAANNLVSGGRSRGLRIMLISQRPAKLHKDSLTQVETLIAMRLIAPQDRAAVESWIGEWSDPKQGKELVATLPSLARGEGWVWAPELNLLTRMAFPTIRTYDSSRAPEDGEVIQAPADLSAIDLGSIREALSVVADGKKEKPKEQSRPIDVQAIKAAEQRGYDRGFKDGERAGLGRVTSRIRDLFHDLEISEQNRPSADPIEARETREANPQRNNGKRSEESTIPPVRRASDPTVTAAIPARTGQPELRILRVLAARHPARFTRAQWATLARMKKTGGTWLTYVSRLRTAGYIEEADGLVGVTKAGFDAVDHVDRPAPGSVVQQWKDALGPGPAKIVDVVLSVYPKGIHRANLADRVGMVATGGTFLTYLSRLKSNGLIDVKGKGREIVANPILFLDEQNAV